MSRLVHIILSYYIFYIIVSIFFILFHIILLCFLITLFGLYCFFFFQAEDGIRDIGVTGVQTCALPISIRWISPTWSALNSKKSARGSASTNNCTDPMPCGPSRMIVGGMKSQPSATDVR